MDRNFARRRSVFEFRKPRLSSFVGLESGPRAETCGENWVDKVISILIDMFDW